MDPLVDVVAVEVLGDHNLRLSFEDGLVGDVTFPDKDTWHGVLEPLKDPAFFAQVRLDPDGHTIAWPNGVDFAPEPLYAAAKANPVTTARPPR